MGVEGSPGRGVAGLASGTWRHRTPQISARAVRGTLHLKTAIMAVFLGVVAVAASSWRSPFTWIKRPHPSYAETRGTFNEARRHSQRRFHVASSQPGLSDSSQSPPWPPDTRQRNFGARRARICCANAREPIANTRLARHAPATLPGTLPSQACLSKLNIPSNSCENRRDHFADTTASPRVPRPARGFRSTSPSLTTPQPPRRSVRRSRSGSRRWSH